jgi:tetratricopeptide (TPR) repeat protein
MSNPPVRSFYITDLNILIARADADYSAQRMTDAARGYRQALAISPRDVHSLHRMGLVSVNLNDITGASAFFELALQVAPARADLWEHAGLVAAMTGEYVQAEAFYRRALGFAGSTATLHRNLADCLRLGGRLGEAKQHYKEALSIQSDLHHAIRAIARISTELGATDEAADYWLRAGLLDSSPLQDGLDLIAAVGRTRRQTPLGDLVAKITAQHGGNVDSMEALCLELYKADSFEDMLNVARRGLTLDPRRVKFHHYAAHALSVRGNVTEALIHSREAAILAPDDPIMQIQLAWLELNDTEYKDGWARSNLFYAMPAARYLRVFPDFPVWDGEPVAGRTFLLVGEEGRGDEIQFIRFAEWLHQRGAIVDVLVSEPVAELAVSMNCVRNVLTSLPSGPYDFWSHMLRMPEHMKLDVGMLPIATSYISAPPSKINYWRSQLDALSSSSTAKKRRIGIVWSGGPNTALDRFRSIDIEALMPLLALPGTTWFSVQKGECERESEALPGKFDLHTLGPAINGFSDTLAVLNSLDLLVTVDTSVAHLAGAANLPVWVLVPAYAQWRWLQNRTDSPWYPSMRLFRQRELGVWAPVIEEVRETLIDWCRSGPNSRGVLSSSGTAATPIND